MSYPSAVTTERLDLRPVDPVADLDALGRRFADPEGGWYEPDSRHTDVEISRGWRERAAADRRRHRRARRANAGRDLGDQLMPLLRA